MLSESFDERADILGKSELTTYKEAFTNLTSKPVLPRSENSSKRKFSFAGEKSSDFGSSTFAISLVNNEEQNRISDWAQTPILEESQTNYVSDKDEVVDQENKDTEAPLLEKLKTHPCKTAHVYNPRTKRMNKVITCLYKNCGRKFTKTWNILDHFKVHTGEKPFQCSNWLKSFSQKGNLSKHQRLHSKWSKVINLIG